MVSSLAIKFLGSQHVRKVFVLAKKEKVFRIPIKQQDGKDEASESEA